MLTTDTRGVHGRRSALAQRSPRPALELDACVAGARVKDPKAGAPAEEPAAHEEPTVSARAEDPMAGAPTEETATHARTRRSRPMLARRTLWPALLRRSSRARRSRRRSTSPPAPTTGDPVAGVLRSSAMSSVRATSVPTTGGAAPSRPWPARDGARTLGQRSRSRRRNLQSAEELALPEPAAGLAGARAGRCHPRGALAGVARRGGVRVCRAKGPVLRG